MLCEVDDYFVASNSDPHVCRARVGHGQRDELAHHEVQIEGRKVRSKLPNDEFEQIESFEVDFRIFLLEQLSEQDLQGLDHLFSLGRR